MLKPILYDRIGQKTVLEARLMSKLSSREKRIRSLALMELFAQLNHSLAKPTEKGRVMKSKRR